MQTCKALTTEDTMWSFCPNMGASVLFIVVFALTTIAHAYQAYRYRKSYSWVIIMSSLWQFLTYIFRALSIQTPASFGNYAAWFVLILIAPLWTNAYSYMVFGRLVWNYTPDRKVWGLRAQRFGVIFVMLDIVAFIVQVYGAAAASAKDAATDDVLRSLHIYMAGVGIQLFFLLICFVFGIRLWLMMRTDAIMYPHLRPALMLLYVQFVVLVLIIVRIVFRIVEYSSGLKSSIPLHEAYQYSLDTLPMFLALLMYNIVHPGRIMQGPETEMPSKNWKSIFTCGMRK
ncbi:rta1 domain-containing protein [Ophiostoma piceae UAMH 11346]|uniref:Rta1 domain-containing protein n=1 Tax=Ophiostoma piceae (strain UAMH 11346) TaxID=1262450 RepID=S3BY64_OPHP1|nr:rta1 domain-containing protein [Ophiostoma piceae UAMH 11346]